MALKPYVQEPSKFTSTLRYGLLAAGLAFFGLIYGFFYALTTPYLLVPFSIPLLITLGLIAWALPDMQRAPLGAMEWFFFAYLAGMIVWPNYLALDLPGLPWITVKRLFGIPMAAMLLLSLAVHQPFRETLGRILRSQPLMGLAMLGLIGMQFATVPFSKAIATSISGSVINQIDWTAMFVVACFVFAKPGRASRWVWVLGACIIIVCLSALWETRIHRLPWADHVPSFLKVDGNYLASIFRRATGVYRAKGMSSTPLGLAEQLAITLPFALHFAAGRYSAAVRVTGAVTAAAMFYVILQTDSRLGLVGSGVALLVYGGLASFTYWRRNRHSLVAASVLAMFPAAGATLVASSFVFHKINVMVWGSGATRASNAGRDAQFKKGMGELLKNPIGHGNGMSGETIGQTGFGNMITVDNYNLTLLMDYGVIGFACWMVFFGTTTFVAGRRSLQAYDRETELLRPLAACLAAFLVIKSVFSQEDNHPLLFMAAGMVVALALRVKQKVTAPAGSPGRV